MFFDADYYTRPSGDQPALNWIEGRLPNERAVIKSKITKLKEEGLLLLQTKMLDSIKGTHDLYELKPGKMRISVYYDRDEDKFILLHGFFKKRRREHHEIKIACTLRDEYLSTKGSV